MKILLAGDWHSNVHETAVADALAQLGHQVVSFAWHDYFANDDKKINKIKYLLSRMQDKFVAGPALAALNRDFVALAHEARPDALIVYRGTHIRADSLREIKRTLPRCVLVGYNNDDPFGPGQPRRLWKHFLAGLPFYDLTLAYRHQNVHEYKAHGARRVELLRSWYVAEKNRPIALTEAEHDQYACDVVFVGHYEPDHRVACLEAIVQRGWKLRLFGPGYHWDPVIRNNPVLKHLTPVRLVWGDDYNRALAGARLALCFLSKLNRDTYTRRCFEIPAAGTVLLSEYTDDLASLYAPDKEAVYFRDKNELMQKIEHYLDDDARRKAVAGAGRHRVQADGHDVVSRMRQVLVWIDEYRGKHGAAAQGD